MTLADTSVWTDYFNGATFCVDNNITLLHNDKDFDPFEKYLGLKVER